jgi:serine/threonine-protein kinase
MKAKFGRYVFLKKLAVGGMAEVFLARRMSFGGFSKFIVIKRLLPSHKGRPAYEHLFLAEARTGALLHHPNIAGLYDLGKLDDHYFMSMEFVHGISLSDLHALCVEQKRAMPLGVIVRFGMAVADALHYAHHTLDDAGEPLRIIHHDITPQNVQIGFEGEVKLLDFGVATRMGRPVAGGRRGKPGYMSPESIRREPLDARSDLYSLGVLLWELSTGRKVARGAEGQPADDWVPAAHDPPSTLVPDFPEALQAALMPALDLDRERRPESGQTYSRALREAARKLELDTSADALVAWLRETLGARIDAERSELIDLARRSDPKPKAAPEAVAAAPGAADAEELAPQVTGELSGEFDAMAGADLEVPDAPPEPAPGAPAAPEPPTSPPATPAEPVARRRGLSPALAVVFGLALGAAGVWFALHSLPKQGSVEVSTLPPEARVYTGEKLLGMTPFVAPNLAVPSTLELRIVAAGHAEWTGTVSVDADRPHRALEITLSPAR